MTDDQLLLASAYVDGDLDDAGRARAEADAEVMAEVARQRAARDLLRDTEAPDPARRERAIAAALAAAAPAPPTAPVVPLRRRRAWWAAGAAAAILAVIAAGIVIARTGSSGGDQNAAVTATTVSTRAAPEAAVPPTGAAVPPTGAASATAAGTSPRASGAAALPALASPQALAAFAAGAGSLRPATATGADTCHAGRFVGVAAYGSPPTTVEVFVVGPDAVALDAATCTEVARAPLH